MRVGRGGSHSTWMAGDKRAHSFCWGPSKWMAPGVACDSHSTQQRNGCVIKLGHGGGAQARRIFCHTRTTAAQSRAQTSGWAGWAHLLDVRQASPQPPQRLSTDAEQEGGALLAEMHHCGHRIPASLTTLCNFWDPQRLVRIREG
jgi:hypothetical protein